MSEERRKPVAMGFEYKNISVPHDMESAYTDGYANFGWEFCGSEPSLQGGIAVVLRFKRRRLKNRSELNQLEKQFESSFQEVQRIRRKMHASAMAPSLALGIVGTVFMTASVLSFVSANILAGILLLIPALVGWALGYFLSVRMKAKKSEQAKPRLDACYDEAYSICEQAHQLLVQQELSS